MTSVGYISAGDFYCLTCKKTMPFDEYCDCHPKPEPFWYGVDIDPTYGDDTDN